MSTVDFGKELEGYVANKLQDLGYKYARRSNGSGNKGELGDIAGQDLAIIECKNRNTKNITINEDVWKKLVNSVPDKSKRFPMYVLGNANKRRWVVLDADFVFEELLKGYLENDKKC